MEPCATNEEVFVLSAALEEAYKSYLEENDKESRDSDYSSLAVQKSEDWMGVNWRAEIRVGYFSGDLTNWTDGESLEAIFLDFDKGEYNKVSESILSIWDEEWTEVAED